MESKYDCLPCPACNSLNQIAILDVGPFSVVCRECLLNAPFGSGHTVEEAIEMWNSRVKSRKELKK